MTCAGPFAAVRAAHAAALDGQVVPPVDPDDFVTPFVTACREEVKRFIEANATKVPVRQGTRVFPTDALLDKEVRSLSRLWWTWSAGIEVVWSDGSGPPYSRPWSELSPESKRYYFPHLDKLVTTVVLEINRFELVHSF